MSISEKLTTVAQNVSRVYMAGENFGNQEGYKLGYANGYEAGKSEGGGGADLPALDVPAEPSDIRLGKEVINAHGEKVTGTMPEHLVVNTELTVNKPNFEVKEGYYNGGYISVSSENPVSVTPKAHEAVSVHSKEGKFLVEVNVEPATDAYNEGLADGKQAEYDRFWDDFQQNGTRKSYYAAFAGACWTPETFKPKYPIKIVDASANHRNAGRMFLYFARGQKGTENARPCSITPDIFDFSECINPSETFNNAWFDEVTVDFGNATELSKTFALGDGGGGIRKINIRVTEKATSFSGTFNYASTLQDLIFTDDSVIAASIDVRRSPLSKASFLSIAHALSPSVTATLSVQKAAVDATFPDRTEWDALFTDKPNWTITEV